MQEEALPLEMLSQKFQVQNPVALFSLIKPKYKGKSLVFANLLKNYLRILSSIENIIYDKNNISNIRHCIL